MDGEVLPVLEEHTGEAVWVEVDGSAHGVCRNPKDDMILECAVKASAGMILSGDLDLVSIRVYKGVSILTPRQYLDFRGMMANHVTYPVIHSASRYDSIATQVHTYEGSTE